MRTWQNTYRDGRSAHPKLLAAWHDQGKPESWPWPEFLAWALEHYTEGATLVRLDTTKPASPDNCKWLDCAHRVIAGATRWDNPLGIKGVSYDRSRGLFEAYITVDRKRHHLGRFDTLADAATARAAAEEYFYPEVAA